MPARTTEYVDLAEIQRMVPSYTRERELIMWDRNGPAGDALAALPGEAPDAVVRYADHEDGLIDLYHPAGPARPSRLVFAVHGGAFRQDWDRGYLRPLARLLNQHGAVVALPEFRRVGGRGGWPVTAYDVADALAAVRPAASAALPGWIDAGQPVVVLGHSAGAHLGPWAALRAGSSVVSRIVAVAAVFDLEFLSRTRHLNAMMDDLLGGSPDEVPDAYREANVFDLVTGEIPLILVQGAEDLQLSVEMSRRAAARLAGRPNVSYVEVADADHFDPVNPNSRCCRDVTVPLVLA
jgi:acetyl esterase/lipase